MVFQLRAFQPDDAEAVNRVALAAFEEYRSEYDDWSSFSAIIGQMAFLSENGELIVACLDEQIVGAVVYVGPNQTKSPYFKADWPILRMLVVMPEYRGKGIGRALTEACIQRARRDGSVVVALHTTPIMSVALGLYERMGFRFYAEAPDIFGVPYGIYLKELDKS